MHPVKAFRRRARVTVEVGGDALSVISVALDRETNVAIAFFYPNAPSHVEEVNVVSSFLMDSPVAPDQVESALRRSELYRAHEREIRRDLFAYLGSGVSYEEALRTALLDFSENFTASMLGQENECAGSDPMEEVSLPWEERTSLFSY